VGYSPGGVTSIRGVLQDGQTLPPIAWGVMQLDGNTVLVPVVDVVSEQVATVEAESGCFTEVHLR
jgi:hypothetical protein